MLERKEFTGSPVLQILGTIVSTNDQGDTHYNIYLSDGEKVKLFKSSEHLNKLHSSGNLSVFTVIKINSINDSNRLIKEITVIANGLEIRSMIGKPTPIDSKMEIWLNFFTAKLEMSSLIQLRVNSFKQQCLNSSKNIEELSIGCLEKIRSGEIIEKPILQVINLVKVTNAEENCFNYSCELSDGKFTFNRFYTRSQHFNNLVASGLIGEFAIIRLEKYEQSDFKSRIKISNVTVVNQAIDVKKIIGEPKPVKDGSSQRYAITDKMLNKLLAYSDLSSSILDTACLSDMQHEVAVTKPILQLIIPYRNQEQINLEISDGLFKIYTEILNPEITEQITSKQICQNSLFRVDEYEVSIVKQEFDSYIPIVNLLKITPLKSSTEIIGKPIPSGACKGMPDHDEDEIFEEEEYDGASGSSSTTKTTLQSLKDFMSNETNDDEDIVSSESAVNIAEMIKKHNELNEQLSSLTIKVNEFNEKKEQFKNDITRLANENIKLKKRYEKMKKTKVMGKQKLIENYLEITGIQQSQNENLIQIFLIICVLIEVQLDLDVDIISISRDPKSRSILVACNNSSIKEKLLDGKRCKDIFSDVFSNLDVPRKRIQMHELLTPFNKLIMFKAKTLKDKGIFDYVWSKNGRVLVKVTGPIKRSIHIYCLEQLKKYSTSS